MIGGTRIDYWRDTLIKRAFIGSGAIGPVGGENSMVQLWNPANSGKMLICRFIQASISAATFVYLHHHNAAIGGGPILGNKYLNEAAGVGLVHNITAAGLLGTAICYQNPTVTFDRIEFLKTDPILIPEGFGLIVGELTVNLALQATFEWIEV